MEKIRAQQSTKSGKYTVKILRHASDHIYPFFIRIECNTGRLAGYSDHPIQYEDGRIVYDNPQWWSKEAKKLVAFMCDVLVWAVKLEDWAGSVGVVSPKSFIPEKIQEVLKTFEK